MRQSGSKTVNLGVSSLEDIDMDNVIEAFNSIRNKTLDSFDSYRGDGKAVERIVEVLLIQDKSGKLPSWNIHIDNYF